MRTAEEKTFDARIGLKIKSRRIELGMTQTDVAEYFNLTFQQMQKIENGSNRIGAGRLYHLSRIFKVSPAYFFEGLDLNEEPEAYGRITLKLMKTFHGLPAYLQAKVLGIVRILK